MTSESDALEVKAKAAAEALKLVASAAEAALHLLPDANYSKRELDEKFLDIKDSLNRIEEQTIKTNGTVADLQRWKYIVMGFCACITAITFPLLMALWNGGKL